jgi:hypothetical protein
MRPLILLLAAGLAMFGQNTAKFPGATATFQDLLIAKGPAKGTLTADINASATAIPVTDGTQYVAFSVVQIRDEVILVCSIASNTLNVCPGGRGFTGTVAQSHTFGQAVRNTVTTHHHNQMAAEMKAIQETLGANLANITKATVGLGNVENAALSTWAGSGNITSIGTLVSGTVPWARLSNLPTSFAPSAHAASHAQGGSDALSGTLNVSIVGNAATVTNGVVTTGSYANPAWITSLDKSKVGLGSVENTALSTWVGSGNITTLGTISSGTVPWARLSNVPSTFAPSAHAHGLTDLPTGDWSNNISSGTYNISIGGSAGSVAWSGVSAKPLGIVDLPISQAIAADDSASNGMALIQRRKGGGTIAPFWVEGTYRVGDILHWSFRVPQDYASGGAVTVFFKMASATSGNVQWAAYVSCYASGYGGSLASKGFATANYSGNLAVPGAAGYPASASWALSSLDGLSVNHFCHVALRRESATSEATGNAEVTGFNFYYNR